MPVEIQARTTFRMASPKASLTASRDCPKLRVMARSTVFRYKGTDADPHEIGRYLGVRALVTGSVLLLDDSLVVKVEMVDLGDGSQVWGNHYNRKVSDILVVQEEISKEITKSLRFRLTNE